MLSSFLQDYVVPVGVSLVLHGLAIGALFVSWQSSERPPEIKRPNYVQATLVKLEAEQRPQKPPQAAKPKVVDVSKQREAQAEAERKKQADLKRQQEAKQKQEQQKKAEAERKRKEAERKAAERKAAERKEAERQAKEKAEAARKKQEQARKQQEQAAFAQALAEEQNQLLEESYAVAAQSYMSAISQRIEQNWSRPPSARNGMESELLIKLVPTGRVVGVDVVRSSGNVQFDRSAVQAVTKAEQFPEIKDMAPEVFERYYRELRLIFRPQDLRQ